MLTFGQLIQKVRPTDQPSAASKQPQVSLSNQGGAEAEVQPGWCF